MDNEWKPVLAETSKPEESANLEDDKKSQSPPKSLAIDTGRPPKPTLSQTISKAPQIKPKLLKSTPLPQPTITNGKRKIDEVTNKSDEPVAKRMLTAPVLQTVVLKDGRTVVLKDGKIVARIKDPVVKKPAKTLSAPVTGKPRTFPTSKPPPIQPNTGEAPPAVGYPPMPMSYPPPHFQPHYFPPQPYPQPVPRYNVPPTRVPSREPMQSTRISPGPERDIAQKRESRWGEIKKYDLKAVITAAQKFMERRTPNDPMQRWKFQGVNGYQIRKNMQKNFPYIKLNNFEVDRWEEFVLKHVPNSEMVGLNVRIKPSVPDQLKHPMEVVVNFLRKHEPPRIEDRVFWKGVGLSVLLGHVQKECPNFKFQRWYKKWKKFVAEIPECQFFQEGNSLSVRLFVENRTEIFERESIRREVSRLRVSRTKSAAKSLKAMTADITLRNVDKESVTLFDILGQCPVEFPARGPRCQHIQPFELSHYLKINMFPESKDENPRWRCQICGEICRKDEVCIDGFWMKVLEHEEIQASKSNIVFLYPDGKVGLKRESGEIPTFEILNEAQMEAGLTYDWEEVVLPPTDRFTSTEFTPESDTGSPNKLDEEESKSPAKIEKDSIERPTVVSNTAKKKRSVDRRRSPPPRDKKRRSRSSEVRSPSFEQRRRRSKERYRRRRDVSEEKPRRRRRRSRSRQRDRRKKKTRAPSPGADEELAMVSTSLLDLYEEMVTNTISTKRGEITADEVNQLSKLRSQCCVEEAQHLEVLKRLGLSMPSP